MTEPAVGEAHARAALAGNPSDGYGGAVLAVTLGEQRAAVTARRAPRLEISPPSEVVAATVARFAREHRSSASATAIEWSTSIPRGVGLGGSSAIVISTLRALSALHDVELEATELAELALAIELDELGIAAGLQDRVAQAFGGLMFMEFDPAAGPDRYRRLDSALLPPLVVAWRSDAAGDSGAVHAPLRDRHDAVSPRWWPRWLRWLDSRGVPATRCSPATTPSSRAASITASTRGSGSCRSIDATSR